MASVCSIESRPIQGQCRACCKGIKQSYKPNNPTLNPTNMTFQYSVSIVPLISVFGSFAKSPSGRGALDVGSPLPGT